MSEQDNTKNLTDKELRGYIASVYGQPPAPNASREEMLAQMEVLEKRNSGNSEIVADPRSEHELKQGYVRIKIMKDSSEPGARGGRGQRQRPAFVSNNGRNYLIPRDMPVVVPDYILSVLEDAKFGVSFQDEETKELVVEDEYTYKFQVLERFDTKAEAEAAKKADAQKAKGAKGKKGG